jgi:hypothetical protein
MRRVFPLAIAAFLVSALLVISSQAQAVVVGDAPTWPIPSDVALAPPPIPTLPSAMAETPPAWSIADPVTSGVSCGGRYQQDRYGNR